MNTQRLIVLGIAFAAAGGAAFLARGMLGGGTPKAVALPAPTIAMTEVLVASDRLQPGQALTPDDVRWQKWPATAVDTTFITHAATPDLQTALNGTVLRVPLIVGQPVTSSALVHASASGFMAALLNPGMRAVSIPITTESGAGGFILPNDRVDIILTRKTNDSSGGAFARTILQDVRVLAVDQTFQQDKNQKNVLAKTATLELTPGQADRLASADAEGTLSLSLRALGDGSHTPSVASNAARADDSDTGGGDVTIIRYGQGQAGSQHGGGAR